MAYKFSIIQQQSDTSVSHEAAPPADRSIRSGLRQLLDDITGQRNWPDKSKAEIDRMLEQERASWD